MAAASNRTTWPALIAAPLVVLADLTFAYSRVTPECARQGGALLHIASAVALVIALGATLQAHAVWRRMRSGAQHPGGAVLGETPGFEERPPFLALVSTLVGALSCAVVVTLWLPLLLLPPCA